MRMVADSKYEITSVSQMLKLFKSLSYKSRRIKCNDKNDNRYNTSHFILHFSQPCNVPSDDMSREFKSFVIVENK